MQNARHKFSKLKQYTVDDWYRWDSTIMQVKIGVKSWLKLWNSSYVKITWGACSCSATILNCADAVSGSEILTWHWNKRRFFANNLVKLADISTRCNLQGKKGQTFALRMTRASREWLENLHLFHADSNWERCHFITWHYYAILARLLDSRQLHVCSCHPKIQVQPSLTSCTTKW